MKNHCKNCWVTMIQDITDGGDYIPVNPPFCCIPECPCHQEVQEKPKEWNEYLTEQLKDPEIKKEYDKVKLPKPEDWENKLYLYHPKHLGESGGICPHCATIDNAKEIIKSERERLYDKMRNDVNYQVPMGVSQWMNHGEKYHYADFWKKKIISEERERLVKEIEGKKKQGHTGQDTYTSATEWSYNQAIQDILNLLK